MTKTLVGRGYSAKGCVAMDAKTGKPVELGERFYHIVKDIYSRYLQKGEYKQMLDAVDVIDLLSGRKYTVEYKPGNLVHDPEVVKAYNEEFDFLKESQEFMLRMKEKVKKGDGCSIIVIAADKNKTQMNVSGLLLGDPFQIADSVRSRLSDEPQIAGLIGAAAMAARFKI